MHGRGKFTWPGTHFFLEKEHEEIILNSFCVSINLTRPDGRVYEGDYINDIKDERV